MGVLMNRPRPLFWYTFQLTPASSRFSGMMRQLNCCSGRKPGSTNWGPPSVPAGSMLALNQ
ncbi:Uncharacterised protein [Mycobacterium tuberculosis]|nr:Uncharacterised protein [Mycobacterium tuberculosis]